MNHVTVTTHFPPTTGLYANSLAAVQVSVTQAVPTIFRVGSYNITASATGVVPPCVYFMSTNPNVTTLTVANTQVHIGCSAYAGYNVNSNPGVVAYFEALYVGGPLSASSLNGTVVAGSPGYYPTFNAPLVSDPLSYLPSPAFSSCTSTNKSISTGTVQLYQGTYCGGITITGGTVNFNPGLYILTGASSWTNATITGSGVTFFLTKGGGSNYGQFLVGSSSTTTNVSLTAPTSGSLPSIVIFGDRNWTTTNTQDVLFNNVNLNLDGVFYLTNTGLSFVNGTFKSPDYFGLVVDNFTLSGSTFTISGNYSGVQGGSPYRPGVGLAE